MRVIIRKNAEEASHWLAKHIVECINSHTTSTGWNYQYKKPFVLGLATGSSPLHIYKLLVESFKRDEVSFQNVITFNMDEYVGLPKEHPESYHSFMWNNLFSHIDIEKESVHILDGNNPDLTQECCNYENNIEKCGGIDLFLGGLGVDGHIAFNEPGTSLRSRTHIQKLTHNTRLVNSRFFDNDISKVPEKAVTVGVATITDSREVVMIVSGHQKATALQKIIEGSVSQMWTASALQLHPNTTIVCDEAACDLLKVSTYHYFKEMDNELSEKEE